MRITTQEQTASNQLQSEPTSRDVGSKVPTSNRDVGGDSGSEFATEPRKKTSPLLIFSPWLVLLGLVVGPLWFEGKLAFDDKNRQLEVLIIVDSFTCFTTIQTVSTVFFVVGGLGWCLFFQPLFLFFLPLSVEMLPTPFSVECLVMWHLHSTTIGCVH